MNALARSWPEPGPSPDPALLLQALRAFPESMAIVEAGRVLYANPAWAHIFEYLDEYRLQGRPLAEFVPPTSHPVAAGPVKDAGASLSRREFTRRCRDGSRQRLQVSSETFRLWGRELQVLTLRELQPRRVAARRSRQAGKMEVLGRMTGAIAHDFNNLLTGVLLYCDLLMAQSAKDGPVNRHARDLRAAGEQGACLVQQLLTASRPQRQGRGVCTVHEVVGGMEVLLRRMVGENIRLLTTLEARPVAVSMSASSVQQIVLNLVLNARDAMPAGGQICLVTRSCVFPSIGKHHGKRRMAPGVEISVVDTGCGIDSRLLDQIFEPFFTTKTQGRGLGLATVRDLARRAGGNVVVESKSGRGACVRVILPEAGATLHLTPQGKR